MDWVQLTKPKIRIKQEEDSSLQNIDFQKTFPHDIHVEYLLEVLEMIYHALLVLCRALRFP